MTLNNYKIIEKIAETRSSLIFRAVKKGERKPVVIKTLKEKAPTPSERARFRQEYETIKKFKIDGIIKAYDIIQDEDGFSLILEDFDSISLKAFLKKQRTDTALFLKLAIKLARTVGRLHKTGIIHRDIKPHNILINPRTFEIKITDFGISSIITGADDEVYNPHYITGTLPYISPEQTGRMNINIDYRTDLYSLGITFFEMVTGIIPFQSRDPLETIHCHIARQAPSADLFHPELPSVISRIIEKLMKKSPEDRYQNAFGLVFDLEECLKQFDQKGYVDEFNPGRKDIADRFIIPQKLYGRKEEVSRLQTSFDNICNGHREIMLITGASGIGKSAVIQEIHKSIVAKKGHFISGKYEQYRSDTPYSAIIQSFAGLIKQLLTENEEKLNQWRKSLLGTLGSNCGIISEIIPEIELITGKQPAPPSCSVEDAQQRFLSTFELFVSVFAQQSHPLTLFLDDIQWIDLSSLNLLKNIMQNNSIRYLFVIFSYRHNELADIHPFNDIINEVEKSSCLVSRIHLEALKVEDITSLISNFLKCSSNKAGELGQIIHKKTDGNPFFINQFLKILYDDKKLVNDPEKGWQWNESDIRKMKVTDNVVELMALKLAELPGTLKETLIIGACIGNRFDLETIAYTLDKSMGEALYDINTAINEGYIRIIDDMFFYNHDRIQEAAYSLIPPDEKAKYHYKIGRRILKKIKSKAERENKLFYLTNQLNHGSSLISDKDELFELAGFNFHAGLKAKSSTAYIPAIKYFEKAAEICKETHWQDEYEFTLLLYVELAETASLNNETEKMEHYAGIILENASSALDQVRVYEIRINSCFAMQDYAGAIQNAHTILKKLDYTLPTKPSKLNILTEYLRVKFQLAGKTNTDIAQIPPMEDPRDMAIARILYIVGISATFSNVNLYALIILKRVHLYLTRGSNVYGGMTFVAYGGFLIFAFNNVKKGIQYGELALNLADIPGWEMIRARTHGTHDAFIRHWKDSMHDCLKCSNDSYTMARESGDLIYTGMTLAFGCLLSFFIADDWVEFKKEVVHKHKLNEKCRQEALVQLHAMMLQFVENMTGNASDPCNLNSNHFDESIVIAHWIDSDHKVGMAYYHILKMTIEYFFHNYSKAEEHDRKAQKYLKAIRPQLIYVCYTFFSPLLKAAQVSESGIISKKKLLNQGRSCLKRLKEWNKTAPEKYTPWIHLIKAEIMGVTGKTSKAEIEYDVAIESFKNLKIPFFSALAFERAGMFYQRRARHIIAYSYISEAHDVYTRTGITSKRRQLERDWPVLTDKKEFNTSGSSINTITGTATTSQRLDLSTIIKSAHAFSGEIIFDKLLKTVMKISIESAGARRGFLILSQKGGAYFIEAEGSVDRSDVKIMQSIPVNSFNQLSSAVINYVIRTEAPVVLHNACEEGDFMADTYIKKNRIKSLMAAPVKNQGKMFGVIYLENNLTKNAFKQSQLEILEMLASQAAISLENSRLFESIKKAENEVRKFNIELEKRVEERTAELKHAYDQIKIMAHTDPLTGLSNRRDMADKIDYEITRLNRSKKPFSIVICDIDDFKSFNDTFGHDCGDYVLVSLAKLIKTALREQDTIARWGGEEFLFLLPETDTEGARILAEKIREKICTTTFNFGNDTLNISMTFGISTINDSSLNIIHYFKSADKALYKGKEAGKNCVIIAQ